jgi:hypothetical protein
MLCAPAAAHAAAFDDVFADYQKDARLTPCDHTAAELRSAKGDVPNDIEQYAPDFPDALDKALEDRARTGCGAVADATTATGAAASPPGPAATTPAPVATTELQAAGATTTVPQPPGSAEPAPAASDGAIVNAAAQSPDRGADETPAPLVALAVLGAFVLLGLLAWALARFFAWDPAWLAGSRHAVQEAGWRVGGLWDDFTDWLRPGRRGAA